VSFVAITLCVASQRVFNVVVVVVVVYFVMTQCGKFWIYPRVPESIFVHNLYKYRLPLR
jgi:hypothetical protein